MFNCNGVLGGGSKYFLFSPRTLGKIPILTNIFQMGWNHQLVFTYNLILLLHPRKLTYLLGQWLNFKLFGITYLVGKIKFKLFFQGPLAKWVKGIT